MCTVHYALRFFCRSFAFYSIPVALVMLTGTDVSLPGETEVGEALEIISGRLVDKLVFPLTSVVFVFSSTKKGTFQYPPCKYLQCHQRRGLLFMKGFGIFVLLIII